MPCPLLLLLSLSHRRPSSPPPVTFDGSDHAGPSPVSVAVSVSRPDRRALPPIATVSWHGQERAVPHPCARRPRRQCGPRCSLRALRRRQRGPAGTAGYDERALDTSYHRGIRRESAGYVVSPPDTTEPQPLGPRIPNTPRRRRRLRARALGPVRSPGRRGRAGGGASARAGPGRRTAL